MDVDLREALHQGFGPEPPHRPVAERLAAGHRAVRRRRAAGSVVAVAFAGTLGLGAALVLGDDDSGRPELATDTGSGLQQGELARYDQRGELQVNSGVTVLDRVDNPFPPSAGFERSVALAVEHDGEESWLLLTHSDYDDGSQSESGAGAAAVAASGSFRDWVAEQVRDMMTPRPENSSTGYLEFADDGSLVATHGIEILDQVLDPPMPEGFAPDDARVAAALLREPDGKRFFVLVVETRTSLETDAEPMKIGGPDLEAFLDHVRDQYLSGEDDL